jgi:drug/metabolite transporter (DMT)-like permease
MTRPSARVGPAAGRSTALPLLAVAVTLLLWSSAFVAIRHLGHSFSPGSLSLGRLLVGSVALGVVLLTRGWAAPSRRDWLGLVAIGVLWFGLYNVALNAGERRVDAGTAAMLIQISPVLVAVLAAVFLKEKATPMLGIGLLVAFTGVVLIATSTSGNGSRDPVGVLLCLVAAAAYAVSLILQKPLVSRLSAIEVTWVACTVGAIACLPFAGSLVQDTADASAGDVAWVVYLGVFPTAIAFSTYAFALASMTAGNLSVTTYLVPPITVLLSWVLLSEVPPAMAYVGGALCLVGVALARRHPGPRVPDGPAGRHDGGQVSSL